jgi:transposase
MNDTTIAVDLAKAVFEVAVSAQPGHVRERQRLSRDGFARLLSAQPAATVVMEACGSAHYWGRRAQRQGHEVVLIPPHVVRPYVRGKQDGSDRHERAARSLPQ